MGGRFRIYCTLCEHPVHSWEDEVPCETTLHDYCVEDALHLEVVTSTDFPFEYLHDRGLVEDEDPHGWVEDSSWAED